MPDLQSVVTLGYRMLRFRTALLIALFVAIADAGTKTNPTHYSSRLLLVLITLAAWYILGTSINDLADEAIDQVNLKGNANRPLINGQASRRSLWLLAGGACLIAMGLAYSLGITSLLITIGAICLSYVYSMPPIQISHRGIVAPLVLPLGYVAYPFLLTLIANKASFNSSRFWLLTGLYISFIARIILKDFRDVKGDAKFGKRTFIVRHGPVATCIVSSICWIIGTSILAVRFWSWPLLAILLLPFAAAILYCLRWLSQERRLKQQVQLVGLIGRLGNGAALLVLTALYYELEPTKKTIYRILLIGIALLGVSSAYSLYQTLILARLKTKT